MSEGLMHTIAEARRMMGAQDYRGCEALLRQAMSNYPDDAAPHNLMGLLYEKRNDHIAAMKHFRAAWALDPTYLPAMKNLESFGSHYSPDKVYIFDESDCVPEKAAVGQG